MAGQIFTLHNVRPTWGSQEIDNPLLPPAPLSYQVSGGGGRGGGTIGPRIPDVITNKGPTINTYTIRKEPQLRRLIGEGDSQISVPS